jgi:hypothetical protein
MADRETRLARAVPPHQGTLAVSHRRTRCEQLLQTCIAGNYNQMPEFAVAVWHYFAEALHDNHADPTATARAVGERAAILLHLVAATSTAAEADDAAAAPPRVTYDEDADDKTGAAKKTHRHRPPSPSPSLAQSLGLFCCGAFATHGRVWPVGWAVVGAEASRHVPLVTGAGPALVLAVGLYGVLIARESYTVVLLQMFGWQVGWWWWKLVC